MCAAVGHDAFVVRYELEHLQGHPFNILIPPDALVSDVVDRIRADAESNHYHHEVNYVWFDGSCLGNEDPFADWYDPEATLIASEASDNLAEAQEGNEDILTDSQFNAIGTVRATIYTTANYASMTQGHEYVANRETTPDQIRDDVKANLRRWTGVSIAGQFTVLVFLPCGVPFVSGTLGEWLPLVNNPIPAPIYAVVTRAFEDVVDKKITEPCDITGDMPHLLSPLCESTPEGLAQMACLIGYLRHQGVKSGELLEVVARLTGFAPALTSWFLFLEGETNYIMGYTIAAITGALYALFGALATDPPANLLENTFLFANYLVTLPGVEFLPLWPYTWNKQGDLKGIPAYLRDHELPRHVVAWEADSFAREEFEKEAVVPESFAAIAEAAASSYFFKPLSITTIKYLYSAAITTGNRLFLGIKGDDAEVIDPARGPDVQLVPAREVNVDLDTDEVMEILNPRIKQIICFAFDCSLSMSWSLDRRPKGVPTRIDIAKNYLNAFVARAATYRVPTCYGCISFDNDVTCLQDVSFLENDFVTTVKGLSHVGQNTALWQGRNAAWQCLRRFNPLGQRRTRYKNARERIIVISDGKDCCGKVLPFDLAQGLHRDGVVVDALMLCREKDFSNDGAELALLTALTDGVIYRPNTPDEGLAVFEEESFLNIQMRKPHVIHDDLWARARDNFKEAAKWYSGTIDHRPEFVNLAIERGLQAWDVDSPAFRLLPTGHEGEKLSSSERRILRELKPFAKPPENIEVWVDSADLRTWRIFIKAPPGTPHEKQSWSGLLEFPNEYPSAPPLLRFLSVPYHPNVSPEGKVLFSYVDTQYTAMMAPFDILTELLKLFAFPELECALRKDVEREFREDESTYRRKAREVAAAVAKETPDEYPYFGGVSKNEAVADDISNLGVESRYWGLGSMASRLLKD
jgi:ubiquitin-protein ligase